MILLFYFLALVTISYAACTNLRRGVADKFRDAPLSSLEGFFLRLGGLLEWGIQRPSFKEWFLILVPQYSFQHQAKG